jgi:hypothetical protein
MNATRKTLKPVCCFLAVLFLLISTFCQYASAAMISTENSLASKGNQETRDDLYQLISREKIQKALVDGGITVDEARVRIDSLTDREIKLIAGKIDEIPSGGDATGFVVISLAVILIVFLIVEYTSDIKMFPQFQFGK